MQLLFDRNDKNKNVELADLCILLAHRSALSVIKLIPPGSIKLTLTHTQLLLHLFHSKSCPLVPPYVNQVSLDTQYLTSFGTSTVKQLHTYMPQLQKEAGLYLKQVCIRERF